MFYFIQNWKYVFYIVSIVSFILFLIVYVYLKESPRFLLLKKDKCFREKMLLRIFNYGKELEYFIEIVNEKNKKLAFDRFAVNELIINQNLNLNLLEKTSEDEELSKRLLDDIHKHDHYIEESWKSSLNTTWPIYILITNKNINNIFFSLCFMWFCISGSYYGILIFAKDLNINVYQTYIWIYILEIFSNVMAANMMEHPELGRKRSLFILLSIIITFIILKYFIDFSSFMDIFLISLRFLISTIYSIIYVYSIEFYPTYIRAKGLSFNAVFGRFSSIFVPFLVEILAEEIFVCFLIGFIVCLLLTFLLKETYNTELEQHTE